MRKSCTSPLFYSYWTYTHTHTHTGYSVGVFLCVEFVHSVQAGYNYNMCHLENYVPLQLPYE